MFESFNLKRYIILINIVFVDIELFFLICFSWENDYDWTI